MQQNSIDPKALQPLFTKNGLPVLAGLGLCLYGSNAEDELIFSAGAALIAGTLVLSLYQQLKLRRYGAAFRRLVFIGICLFPAYYLIAQEPDPQVTAVRSRLHGNLCPSWFEMGFYDKYVRNRDRAWCRDYADYHQPPSQENATGQSTGDLWR